jgi:hypothetical protein
MAQRVTATATVNKADTADGTVVERVEQLLVAGRSAPGRTRVRDQFGSFIGTHHTHPSHPHTIHKVRFRYDIFHPSITISIAETIGNHHHHHHQFVSPTSPSSSP